MTFLWSEALWLLSAVPLLSAAYVYVLRHRVKASARYAGMTWYRPSAALMHSVKNRLPACLLLIALIAMVIAIARPIATITLPATFSTVVLALDVSASMRATDVKPMRLGAVQAAARSFVNDQPQGTRIGVVSFAQNAAVLQRPTSDKTEVLSALDHLEMQRGTALGKAVMASLKTIFPDEKLIDDPANTVKAIDADIRIRPQLALRYEKGPALAQPDNSSAIVLVSDGEDTADSHVTAALHLAAERGVRIFTVGIGTLDGEIVTFEGWRSRVRLDEKILQGMAAATGGEYFHAESAADPTKIYRSLSSRSFYERQDTEITALFAAAGAWLLELSALLSLAFDQRIL